MSETLTQKVIRHNPSGEEIIRALGGNPATGMCLCPAHNDQRKPSLHVSDKNGKPLWKCHAGCSQESVTQALIARGIWSGKRQRSDTTVKNESPVSDKLDDNARLRRASALFRVAYDNDPNILSTYFSGRGIDNIPISAMALTAKDCRRFAHLGLPAYPAMVCTVIRDGKLVGAHVTMLSKDGSKKLISEKSKLMFGPVKGGYIPISVLDPDRPLLIAEGIETALSASQIASGLPVIAAGNAPQMKSLIVPKASEYIICADNDKNKTGQNAAKFLAKQLANAGHLVRVAVPEYVGEDWNDVLLDDRDKLKTMRDRILNAKSVSRDKRVSALSVADFLSLTFPKREFMLKPWLTTTSLAMIDAQAGHCKTWLALSIAYAVATGQALMGWEVERSGRVLYVDGELPGELLQKRLRMLGPPNDNLRVLSHSQFEMRSEAMPDIGEEVGRDFLDRVIEQYGIDLVILDSVSTLVRSGMDNDVESWRAVQAWSLKHRARGRAVITCITTDDPATRADRRRVKLCSIRG
jgi:putative DNA primase/helicase